MTNQWSSNMLDALIRRVSKGGLEPFVQAFHHRNCRWQCDASDDSSSDFPAEFITHRQDTDNTGVFRLLS
jgi:hypothetical protein